MIASGKSLWRSTIFAAAAALFTVSADTARTEEGRRFDLRVENGRVVGDLKVVRVRRDDTVEIHWTADRRTVVHLHGYDIETVIEAGAPKTMSFRARATGRFPIETHGAGGRHRTLIHLEVHPR